MEKVSFNLLDAPEGAVLTIMEGKALTPREPVTTKITGDIRSVAEFLKKRLEGPAAGNELQQIDKGDAVITVNEDGMTILLEVDPNNPFGTTVLGKLEYTAYLEQFFINQKHTFTKKEMTDLLKFSKLLFENPDQHEKLLKAYQTFDFSAMIKASQEEDSRGNRSMSLDKKIKTNLPDDFILRLPIFKGQGPEKFRVEICYDTSDASIKFWLESTELHDLIEQRKIEILIEQLAPFQDFVIIYK